MVPLLSGTESVLIVANEDQETLLSAVTSKDPSLCFIVALAHILGLLAECAPLTGLGVLPGELGLGVLLGSVVRGNRWGNGCGVGVFHLYLI